MSPQFGKVAVLMGGISAEREVSLNSGAAVYTALKDAGVDVVAIDADQNITETLKQKKIDRVFNVLHGRGGEDGAIQGCLEWLNIPYTGSKVKASALTMDKNITKQIWKEEGLKVAASFVAENANELIRVEQELGFPVVVKPTSEGSSFGVSIVKQPSALLDAWQKASQYGDVLVEKYISGVEYTVSILADETLPIIKLQPAGEFYDFEAKYIKDDTKYICPCGLDEKVEKKIQQQCKHAFDVTGCQGWGRVDVIYDGKDAYLIEVNTVPGMTSHSLVPMAAKAAGRSFQQLVVEILQQTLGNETSV